MDKELARKFREHDVVRVVSDIHSDGVFIPKGTTATIIHIHGDGEAFILEFFDKDGSSIVATVEANEVEKAKQMWPCGMIPTECWCSHCNPPRTFEDMLEGRGCSWMIVCPSCGNKRCPKANHHDNACTNSNAPGQKGSSYE